MSGNDDQAVAPVATCGVVAIGRNEGERLRQSLASLRDYRLPVVYVDSASTDGSCDLARQMGAAVVDLDLSRPFTAARARNEGFARLRDIEPDLKYVQFVDGDCEVERGWIETALAALEGDDTLAAVCGRRRERYPQASFYNALCDSEWDTPVGSALSCGGDSCLRVAAFEQAGGFDGSVIAGEEPEMCHRLRGLGWTIRRLDAPMTVHDADMHHLRQWWVRAVRSGFGYTQVWDKTRRTGRDVLFDRELKRALGWTLGVPVLGLLLALVVGPAGLLAIPGLWLAQFARISLREGPQAAAHLMLGKAAETLGALRFAWLRIRGKKRGAIFYK